MTVTATTEPTYVIPGRKCEVTLSASAGNLVRLVLTAAPEASSWAKRLRDDDRSEIQLWAAASGEKHPFTFDVPGVYVCTAREFTRGGVSFGGDYQGDPEGNPTETAVSSTALTFTVGQRMTATVQVRDESGTLTLWVWGTTIRETTVPQHGEQSPRFEGATVKMKTAAASSAVQTALAALVGVACDTAAGLPETTLNNLITKWNLHIAVTAGGVHAGADAANAIDTDYAGANNAAGLSEVLAKVGSMMRRHFLNDSGTGPASAAYHTAGDWDKLPLITGAGDALSASLALASFWHSYELHRVNTSVHGAADSTNTLTALPALYSVYQKIFAVLQSNSPTAPATDNAGATVLVHRAGLIRS